MFRKTLLALSLLTLALAGAAGAADTDWTFYGAAHASLNSLSNGTDRQSGLTTNSSRFGFRGATPMNGSFTAFWQFESQLDMVGNSQNDGDGSDGLTVGTRNTFVGLKHENAGKFVAGRHDTPFKALGRMVEIFPDQLGDFRSLTQGWDSRLPEIAAWVSPDWDGFSIFAAYQFDLADLATGGDPEVDTQTSVGLMGTYTTERLMLGAAYQGFSEGYDAVGGGEVGDGPSAIRFAARYTARRFMLAGLYQTMTAKFYGDGTFEDRNLSVMGLGGSFHATDEWNLKAAVHIYNDNTDAVDLVPVPGNPDVDESDTRATMVVLGVERVLTENILVYAQVASMDNGDILPDTGGTVSLGGYDSGFGAEVAGSFDGGEWQDPSGFSMGAVFSW